MPKKQKENKVIEIPEEDIYTPDRKTKVELAQKNPQSKILSFDYPLVRHQLRFHTWVGKIEELAMVCGYGAGKSLMAVLVHLMLAVANLGHQSVFAAPTYKMLSRISYRDFKSCVDRLGIPHKFYRSVSDPRLTIFINHKEHTIFFYSMTEPESLVGANASHASFDEIDTVDTEKAELSYRKGGVSRVRVGDLRQIFLYSTPEGHKFLYKHFDYECREDKLLLGYRKLIRGRTRENIFLPDDYIPKLRRNFPGFQLDGYLDGRFVNMTTGIVYREFNRKKNASSGTPQFASHYHMMLHIGMDFNVRGMSAVVFIIDEEDDPHAIWEFSGQDGTKDMIRAIKEEFPWAERGGEWKIIIYPDATAIKTFSSQPDESDIDFLESAGFRTDHPRKQYSIKSRVNALNTMFCNADKQCRLRVNIKNCHKWVECLEQQPWDVSGKPEKKSGKYDKSGLNDAAGYFINRTYEMGIKPSLSDSPFM